MSLFYSAFVASLFYSRVSYRRDLTARDFIWLGTENICIVIIADFSIVTCANSSFEGTLAT